MYILVLGSGFMVVVVVVMLCNYFNVDLINNIDEELEQ